jgi:serine/threonine-protein kinase
LGKDVNEAQVIKLGMDICNALVSCKKHNIIHRDIKPANIMISEDGMYKLGDFGIAKSSDRTSNGTVAGTLSFMAPEVYGNRPYGALVDIYSLGMVMYILLNENVGPFLPLPPVLPKSSEMENARRRRFNGEALPAPKHGSPALQQIVLKACASEPADRYASAEEMLAALRDLSSASVGKLAEAALQNWPMRTMETLQIGRICSGRWSLQAAENKGCGLITGLKTLRNRVLCSESRRLKAICSGRTRLMLPQDRALQRSSRIRQGMTQELSPD